jgi:hypothetical protein
MVGYGTIGDRFEDVYDELAFDLADVHGDFELTGNEPNEIPTFEDALAIIKISGRSLEPGDELVSDDPKTFRDAEGGITTISNSLAATLSKRATELFKREFAAMKEQYGVPGKNKDGGSRNATPEQKNLAYGTLNINWSALVERFGGGEFVGTPRVTDEGAVVITLPEFNEKNQMYSAVLPISDHRGYEVIGTYAYGRGLSIEPGGNLEQLMDSNRFDYVSLEAIEEFLLQIQENPSPSKALGLVAQNNPEAAAELAAAAGIEVQEGETVLQYQGDMKANFFENQFRNYVSSSAEFSQKVSVTNAAYSLADMGLHTSRQICECKGAEADQLLLAFGNETFVNVDQPDEVSAWVSDQMQEQALAWQSSQDALRGRVLDVRNTVLSDAFQAIANKEVPGAQLVSTAVANLEEVSTTQAEQQRREIEERLEEAFNVEEEG